MIGDTTYRKRRGKSSLVPQVELSVRGVEVPSRSIDRSTERELWARAAGRCEFSGCNELLYRSPVTQERVNMAQMAHIYSFSEFGPRGRGPLKGRETGTLNDVQNLMLVCYGCHRTIDSDKEGVKYSAELLKKWKEAHEARIFNVTGINPGKRSHVVLYGARIDEQSAPLNSGAATEAMFPDWNPAEEKPVSLSMSSAHNDSEAQYWESQSSHLQREYERQIRRRLEDGDPSHFSIFALAPQPLLILLGTLLTDKTNAIVYQLHREPPTWKWQPHPDGFEFKINSPVNKSGSPVLVFSLSARIATERISAVVSGPLSVWEVTVPEPNNDFLRSPKQLELFRTTARKVLESIHAAHPGLTKLPIFPAMPIACATELGRARMPKADPPWLIYDQNHKHKKFIPTLTIGSEP